MVLQRYKANSPTCFHLVGAWITVLKTPRDLHAMGEQSDLIKMNTLALTHLTVKTDMTDTQVQHWEQYRVRHGEIRVFLQNLKMKQV